MTRRNEDITFHQADGVQIVQPIRDGQSGDFLDLTNLQAENVEYRIASSYDDADVIYEADAANITVDTWGNTDAEWPGRLGDEDEENITAPADSVDVVLIELPPADTADFSPAADETVPELVHQLKITSAGDIGAQVEAITVFEGDVTILPSATVEVSSP